MATPKGRPGRKIGRPSKLTEELTERLCKAIRAGCFVETAVAMNGLHKDTFYDWLKRGAKEKRGPHRRFSDAIQKAMAEFEAAAVARIAKAGTDPKLWYATAWLLERKFPARYARPEVKAEHFGDEEEKAPRLTRMPIAGPGQVKPAEPKGGDGG